MPAICETLRGQFGYGKNSMSVPPSESGANVIQFSLTEGCDHARCTFCNLYKKGTFKQKNPREFTDHVDQVIAHLEENPQTLYPLNRIFIGGGNAFKVETDELIFDTQYALESLYEAQGYRPRRLAIYGNTNSILEKSMEELMDLNCGGTCGNCSKDIFGEKRGVEVVYWGLESGDTEVLRIGGKGYTETDAMIAAEKMQKSGIRSSVMVIPGLGGKELSVQHVEKTIQVLNQLEPEWITFMGLLIDERTRYASWIRQQEAQGGNRRLTPQEMAEETAQMIERLTFQTKIGVYGDHIHDACHNPVPIGGFKIRDERGAKKVAQHLRTATVKTYSKAGYPQDKLDRASARVARKVEKTPVLDRIKQVIPLPSKKALLPLELNQISGTPETEIIAYARIGEEYIPLDATALDFIPFMEEKLKQQKQDERREFVIFQLDPLSGEEPEPYED